MNSPLFLKSIIALGLTLTLSACQPKPLTEQEQRTVTQLTTNMKTQCVGRYLIDLPADVDIYGHAKLNDVDVKIEPMSQQAFLDGMHKRDAELKAMKHIHGYQFLFGDNEYHPMNSSTEQMRKKGIWHFIHLDDEYSGDMGRTLEAYKWNKGYRIKLETKTWDYTRSIVKDKPRAKEMGNRVPSRLGDMMSLLHDFRGLSNGEIPKEPGVCLTGGFIKSEASDEEEVSMSFYLRDKRDVSFDLETNSNIREKTTLLQRGSQIEKAVKTRDGHTIRKGKIDLPGLTSAEEWLLTGITNSKVMGHRFALEANSIVGSAQTPLLILDMDNGAFPQDVPRDEIIKASLTEGEAVALWDAVSRTIRVRPGAMDAMPLPTVSATEHRLPLGTVVCSGQTCRQGGYYHTHWNGETYRKLLCPDRPAPTLNLMEPVPYRWLPGLVNRMLLKHERLPMALASHQVDWVLTSYFL
ncbi:T6SS immunity protein Tli4 family protein [Herbaspirillum sp. RV1423]|uniref:T6SS immunity protein Tli4 family protein n=1 Tax=Herbaspirillum sp. RV1423 TaxID=1443993 RepID=UPI0004B7FBE0|nr:T6SS immunity protein Tli4 family protein [Herbaspirillum sp. RV1423]